MSAGEWVVTLGGDGFWQAIDPDNPDIVYSEYQYGNITRYDKKSGEGTGIKPQPGKGKIPTNGTGIHRSSSARTPVHDCIWLPTRCSGAMTVGQLGGDQR